MHNRARTKIEHPGRLHALPCEHKLHERREISASTCPYTASAAKSEAPGWDFAASPPQRVPPLLLRPLSRPLCGHHSVPLRASRAPIHLPISLSYPTFSPPKPVERKELSRTRLLVKELRLPMQNAAPSTAISSFGDWLQIPDVEARRAWQHPPQDFCPALIAEFSINHRSSSLSGSPAQALLETGDRHRGAGAETQLQLRGDGSLWSTPRQLRYPSLPHRTRPYPLSGGLHRRNVSTTAAALRSISDASMHLLLNLGTGSRQ